MKSILYLSCVILLVAGSHASIDLRSEYLTFLEKQQVPDPKNHIKPRRTPEPVPNLTTPAPKTSSYTRKQAPSSVIPFSNPGQFGRYDYKGFHPSSSISQRKPVPNLTTPAPKISHDTPRPTPEPIHPAPVTERSVSTTEATSVARNHDSMLATLRNTLFDLRGEVFKRRQSIVLAAHHSEDS